MADTVTEIAIAQAGFAASAVARLADALRRAGSIDDALLGELAGVAIESGSGKGDEVAKAMRILCIQLEGGGES